MNPPNTLPASPSRRRAGQGMVSFAALSPGPLAALLGLAVVPERAAAQEGAGAPGQAAHVLNRLGFGPRPGDLARVSADPRAWIEQQLQPASLPLPASLSARLQESAFLNIHPLAQVRRLRELQRSPILAQPGAQALSPPSVMLPAPIASSSAPSSAPASASLPGMEPPTPALRNPANEFINSVAWPAIEARLLRALESPRQLEEVMVDFWFNHFNVYQGKNVLRVLTGHYEHYAIRPFALGRFRDLLGATARHPAMLYYLDNALSVAPGTGLARNSPRGLNENYARELMELHTLGVDGGYTQRDVTELARILTGWMIQPVNDAQATAVQAAPGDIAGMPGFWFNARVHDQGEKQWLGHRVTPQGQAEGDFALDVLSRHPATARHIAFKLAQYFVADQPAPALVTRLAQAFQAHDGAIVPVLRQLFSSPEFWSAAHQGNKFKTPYQFTLSAVRAAGASPERLQPLAGAMAAQGMPLYGCQTPDGYKNTESAWLNPDAMTRRINFASFVASGRLANGAAAAPTPESLLSTLGPLVNEQTRQLASESANRPALASALILAGPAMMRR